MVFEHGKRLRFLADADRIVADEWHFRAQDHATKTLLCERLLDRMPLALAQERRQARLQDAIHTNAVAPHVDHEDSKGAIPVEVPLLHLALSKGRLDRHAVGVPELPLVHAVHFHSGAQICRSILLRAIRLPEDRKVVRDVIVAPDHQMRGMRQRRGSVPLVPSGAVRLLKLLARPDLHLLGQGEVDSGPVELQHPLGGQSAAVCPGVDLIAQVQHHVAFAVLAERGQATPRVLVVVVHAVRPVAAQGREAKPRQFCRQRHGAQRAAVRLQLLLLHFWERVKGDAVLRAWNEALQAEYCWCVLLHPAARGDCLPTEHGGGGAREGDILVDLQHHMRGALGHCAQDRAAEDKRSWPDTSLLILGRWLSTPEPSSAQELEVHDVIDVPAVPCTQVQQLIAPFSGVRLHDLAQHALQHPAADQPVPLRIVTLELFEHTLQRPNLIFSRELR
mmetsp:Transcript_46790/g.130273  ORF Transcript_46790/g.130273 Transcript_46790/m.130273 type:complete len:448 (+) Transcript_46790:395-1738(+)